MKINDLSVTQLGDLLYHLNNVLSIVETKRIAKIKKEVAARANLLSNLMPNEQKAIDAGIKVTKASDDYDNYEGEVIVIEGNLKWRAVGVPEKSVYSTVDMHFNSMSYIEFYPLNF